MILNTFMETLKASITETLNISEKTASMYIYYLYCANNKNTYTNIKFLYNVDTVKEHIDNFSCSTKLIIIGTIIRILKYYHKLDDTTDTIKRKYKKLLTVYTSLLHDTQTKDNPNNKPLNILDCIKMILEAVEHMVNIIKQIQEHKQEEEKEDIEDIEDNKPKRKLPLSLQEAVKVNQYIAQELNYKICPVILKFVKQFREKAKEQIEDKTDFISLNNRVIHLFNEYIHTHGEEKVLLQLKDMKTNKLK
jgi:hypothetical protein